MDGKNYAKLVKLIFSEPMVLSTDEELNQNQELGDALYEILEKHWDSNDMEYMAIDDFVLEGMAHEELAEYLRENADQVARHIIGTAVRRFRHPSNSRGLRQYVKLREDQ